MYIRIPLLACKSAVYSKTHNEIERVSRMRLEQHFEVHIHTSVAGSEQFLLRASRTAQTALPPPYSRHLILQLVKKVRIEAGQEVLYVAFAGSVLGYTIIKR